MDKVRTQRTCKRTCKYAKILLKHVLVKREDIDIKHVYFIGIGVPKKRKINSAKHRKQTISNTTRWNKTRII